MIRWRCTGCGQKNSRNDRNWTCSRCGKEVEARKIGRPMIVMKTGFTEFYPVSDEADRLESELPDSDYVPERKRSRIAVSP